MATQGTIAVIKNGQVVMKIVAGCDGYNAKATAETVGKSWPLNPRQAMAIAGEKGFGCPSCLVVITDTDLHTDSEDEPNELYRKTFKDPHFNPRWKYGTADYTEIAEVQ